MHVPLNSLVRILRIKHIAHLQSNRHGLRVSKFHQFASFKSFLIFFNSFQFFSYISPHETHEMYLVGIVLQGHKGIPVPQCHGAKTVRWTVPDQGAKSTPKYTKPVAVVAQNTPSAHIQDLRSTVLFPGANTNQAPRQKVRPYFVKAFFDQSFNRMLPTTITSAFHATNLCCFLRHLTTLSSLRLPSNSRIFRFLVLISSASSSPPLPTLDPRPQNAVPRPSVKVVDFHRDRQSLTRRKSRLL